ncbi:MAG TPA: hypothetical protein VJ939_00335 [Bacteroidales bacterium]|nr:hypothetical protein [Bacteroidales bacterium]
MKTNKKLQTILLTVLALIIGFFAGTLINFPKTSEQDVAGTIGQVDRYRNVQITEQDLKLRNSLVDDTAKHQAFKTYLQYYYYHAIRTLKDINEVLNHVEKAEEFSKKKASPVKELKRYENFLLQRRVDVMEAMRMVANLDKDNDVPVISYLNNANNFISRMKVNEKTLIGFNEEIKDYVESHHGQEIAALKDAHDIISTNLFQSAIMTGDRPVKAYLKQDGYLNNEAGLKALLSSQSFHSFMKDQLVMDAEKLGFKMVVGNKEELAGSCMLDMETLGLFDAEKLGDAALAGEQTLQAFTNYDNEKLGGGVSLLDVNNLQSYLSFDSENLNFIMPLGNKANIIGSNEALRASLMDAEKIGLMAKDKLNFGSGSFDAERLGLLVILNNREELGSIAFDAASLGILYSDTELLGAW